MTDWATWFRYQLQASADGFAWAFMQLSPSLHKGLPPEPAYLGTWSPARHLWHVTEYERWLVIPSMAQWLGGALPSGDVWADDDESWAKAQERGSDELISAFKQVRQQQIDMLEQLASVDWDAPRETLWGMKPLSFIVTKTFQHTYEHGDTLLRMGLWWEFILGEMAKHAANPM
jgi:hypothetical protein